MMTTSSPLTYITYLMRLWRSDETTPWRVSLHDPHTGDKHNFASLGLMMDFLSAQAGEGQGEARGSGNGERGTVEGQSESGE